MTLTPRALGGALHDLDEILGLVVDRDVGPELAAGLAFLGVAGGDEDPGAEGLGELDGAGADARSAAVDEDRLARRQPAALEDRRPDGEEGLGDRRRLLDREPLRDRQRVRLVDLGSIRHSRRRAAGRTTMSPSLKRAAPSPRATTSPATSSPGISVGRARRRRVLAAALHDVGPVHAGGADLDQDLAGTGNRHRPFRRDQHFGAAGRLDHDRGHRLGKRRQGRESFCPGQGQGSSGSAGP